MLRFFLRTCAARVAGFRLRSNPIVVFLLAFCIFPGPLLTGVAMAQFSEPTNKPFDETPYDTNIGFSGPMSTISGLTDWGKDINHVYAITTWITVVIFFLVAIPVCVAIYKFRAKPGETDDIPPKQVHGNVLLELSWTIGPVIMLLFIAVPTWQAIFRQGREPGKDALVVEVTGHQWWWEFHYPAQNITTANELYLPENQEVYFKIMSADVIHSFWIPQWGGKVDALPRPKGEFNPMLVVTPALPDDKKVGGQMFQGHCVELCGPSHALMRFNASLRTKEEFDRWVASYNQKPLVATDMQRKGEQVFAQCIGCHTIYGTPSADIAGDKIGPNLTNFGNRSFLAAGTRRNTPENLALWINDPPSIKPGALMPKLGLSKEDIAAVSAYIRQSTAKQY